MKLSDVMKLKIGESIRSNLSFGTCMSIWQEGTIAMPPKQEGGFIHVTIRTLTNSSYHIYVDEVNRQHFKLANQEWDEEDNEGQE